MFREVIGPAIKDTVTLGAIDCANRECSGVEKTLAGAELLAPVVGKQFVRVGGALISLGKKTDEGIKNLFNKSDGVNDKVVQCFPAGTLVLMADGSKKPIETIVAGELVLADNPTDLLNPREYMVQALIESNADRLIRITTTSNESENENVIEATSKHPFWTVNKGWTYSRDLVVGDVLQDHEQEKIYITETEVVDKVIPTYNLSVEDVSTYFVMSGDNSILVHNIDPFEIEYTRQVNPGEVFSNGDWKGKTVQSAVDQAINLGRLPDGLELNAARFRSGGREVIEAINNRTLFVARQAGLQNVNPINNIDSSKAFNQAQEQKMFANKSGSNICPR